MTTISIDGVDLKKVHFKGVKEAADYLYDIFLQSEWEAAQAEDDFVKVS
jgi:hypothetical protein